MGKVRKEIIGKEKRREKKRKRRKEKRKKRRELKGGREGQPSKPEDSPLMDRIREKLTDI